MSVWLRWCLANQSIKTSYFVDRQIGSEQHSIAGFMACIWLASHPKKRMIDWRSISVTLVRALFMASHPKQTTKWFMSSFRSWQRAFLDFRYWFGRWRKLFLDGKWSTNNIHKLERWRAEQLPLRERRGGELPRALESRRKGAKMERHAVLVWDVFRLWSAIRHHLLFLILLLKFIPRNSFLDKRTFCKFPSSLPPRQMNHNLCFPKWWEISF